MPAWARRRRDQLMLKQGRVLPGVDMKIVDGDGTRAAMGRHRVRGPEGARPLGLQCLLRRGTRHIRRTPAPRPETRGPPPPRAWTPSARRAICRRRRAGARVRGSGRRCTAARHVPSRHGGRIGHTPVGVDVGKVEPQDRNAAVGEPARDAFHERVRHAGAGAVRDGRYGRRGRGGRPQRRDRAAGGVQRQRVRRRGWDRA